VILRLIQRPWQQEKNTTWSVQLAADFNMQLQTWISSGKDNQAPYLMKIATCTCQPSRIDLVPHNLLFVERPRSILDFIRSRDSNFHVIPSGQANIFQLTNYVSWSFSQVKVKKTETKKKILNLIPGTSNHPFFS
jgi:hypothetical protein